MTAVPHTLTRPCPSAVTCVHTQGPTYSVTVNGGECEINDDGSVECEEPFVELSETPFICNLPYREAAELEVRGLVVVGPGAREGCGVHCAGVGFGLSITSPHCTQRFLATSASRYSVVLAAASVSVQTCPAMQTCRSCETCAARC
jgi:hypothetical protein